MMSTSTFRAFFLSMALASTMWACGSGTEEKTPENSGPSESATAGSAANEGTESDPGVAENTETDDFGDEGGPSRAMYGTWKSGSKQLSFSAEPEQLWQDESGRVGNWHVYDGMLFLQEDKPEAYELDGKTLTFRGDTYTLVSREAAAPGFGITGTNVNVRQSHDTDAPVVFKVNSGDKVKLVGESTFFQTIGDKTDFWYQIEKDGKKGWIFGAFTSKKLSMNPRTDRLRFNGAGLGDYFHMGFEWPNEAEANGRGWACDRYYMDANGQWDFGYGGASPTISGYELWDEDDAEGTKPNQYFNKLFDVTWSVEGTDAYEGDGSMETVYLEVPVIHEIKLVE